MPAIKLLPAIQSLPATRPIPARTRLAGSRLRAIILPSLAVLAATALPIRAAWASDVALSLDGGSTGVGAHLSVALTSSLNARFGINHATYDFDGNTSDVNYRFNVKLNTLDALLDWFPMEGNQFRLTGGVVYNNNKVDATGRPSNGTYTINGNTYSSAAAGQVDGKIEFRKFAPYVGVGWGNPFAAGKGWGFMADLGLMYQGSGSTTLTSSGCTAGAQVCSQLSNDLAAENARLADKANNYRLFPVARVGVSYRF